MLVLSVKSAEAKLSWMPIDYEKEEGLGYFLYEAGTVSYEVGLTQLEFSV